MLIVDKSAYNNIFDNNVRYTVYKDNRNNLYGFILIDGTVELYNPRKSSTHDMYINDKVYKRIEDIHNNKKDTRVDNLWDFILHDGPYYIVQYEDTDLLR